MAWAFQRFTSIMELQHLPLASYGWGSTLIYETSLAVKVGIFAQSGDNQYSGPLHPLLTCALCLNSHVARITKVVAVETPADTAAVKYAVVHRRQLLNNDIVHKTPSPAVMRPLSHLKPQSKRRSSDKSYRQAGGAAQKSGWTQRRVHAFVVASAFK